MNDKRNPAAGDVVSFRLEGALAAEVDWIAQREGISRSEILRRMLLASLDSGESATIRCVRDLDVIHGRLEKIAELLEDVEESDAAELVQDAVNSVVEALEELGEEFEEEDD